MNDNLDFWTHRLLPKKRPKFSRRQKIYIHSLGTTGRIRDGASRLPGPKARVTQVSCMTATVGEGPQRASHFVPRFRQLRRNQAGAHGLPGRDALPTMNERREDEISL